MSQLAIDTSNFSDGGSPQDGYQEEEYARSVVPLQGLNVRYDSSTRVSISDYFLFGQVNFRDATSYELASSPFAQPAMFVGFKIAAKPDFAQIIEGLQRQQRSLNGSDLEIHIGSDLVEHRLGLLFSAAEDELFEAGITSPFARGLQQLSSIDSFTVMHYLKEKLVSVRAPASVLGECLRWASRQDALNLRESVLELLCLGLNHSSALVRDSAALSLADFDESVAKEHISRAAENEKIEELKEDLYDLLSSLDD